MACAAVLPTTLVSQLLSSACEPAAGPAPWAAVAAAAAEAAPCCWPDGAGPEGEPPCCGGGGGDAERGNGLSICGCGCAAGAALRGAGAGGTSVAGTGVALAAAAAEAAALRSGDDDADLPPAGFGAALAVAGGPEEDGVVTDGAVGDDLAVAASAALLLVPSLEAVVRPSSMLTVGAAAGGSGEVGRWALTRCVRPPNDRKPASLHIRTTSGLPLL